MAYDWIQIARAQRLAAQRDFGIDRIGARPQTPFFYAFWVVAKWREWAVSRFSGWQGLTSVGDQDWGAASFQRSFAAQVKAFRAIETTMRAEAFKFPRRENAYGVSILTAEGANAFWNEISRLALAYLDTGVPITSAEMGDAVLQGASEGWTGVKKFVGSVADEVAEAAGDAAGSALNIAGGALGKGIGGFLDEVGWKGVALVVGGTYAYRAVT